MNGIVFLLVFICSMKNIDGIGSSKLRSVFYGNEGWSMDEIENLSLWIGKHPTVIVIFTDWCNSSMDNLFNIQLNNIWNNGSIPLITWELFLCGSVNQPGIIRSVNNNLYDTYINQFGDRLKIWLAGNDGIFGNNDDRRAYLRPGHEMNGNWYPWSLNSTPNEYISAWHHIHQLISNQNLDSTRLQWIWCVNNVDVGNYTAENYWVGENYLDWIAIDGYNFGTTQTWTRWLWPNEIFDDIITRLNSLSSTKPICISEYATTTIFSGNISNIQSKINWLNQFCDFISNNNQIKMVSYFNQDKETDWAIFGGLHGDVLWNNFSVYSAYNNCLQSNYWIETDNTNQRIINDQQFAGTETNTVVSSSQQRISGKKYIHC